MQKVNHSKTNTGKNPLFHKQREAKPHLGQTKSILVHVAEVEHGLRTVLLIRGESVLHGWNVHVFQEAHAIVVIVASLDV